MDLELVEKIKLQYRDTEVEIYDSSSQSRLSYETFEEYKVRQQVMNAITKARKNSVNMKHVSKMLIPAFSEDGRILIDKISKKPIFIGETKGISFTHMLEQEKFTGKIKELGYTIEYNFKNNHYEARLSTNEITDIMIYTQPSLKNFYENLYKEINNLENVKRKSESQ